VVVGPPGVQHVRYINQDVPEKGGAIAVLDHSHAYDYVAWPFLHQQMQCLEAFGLSRRLCFRAMVRTMYTNVSTRLKINTTRSPPHYAKTSGVIQGCPLSSLLFLSVMEVLLTMIREDETITGIEIPGPSGGHVRGETETVKERSLADDLAVYMDSPRTSVPALCAALARRFSDMSGHSRERRQIGRPPARTRPTRRRECRGRLGPVGRRPRHMVAGHGAHDARPLHREKYHGIQLTTVHGATEQYEKKAGEMRARIADDAWKAFVPRSVEGRQSLARGRYAGGSCIPSLTKCRNSMRSMSY
jgi:hypothetical protein